MILRTSLIAAGATIVAVGIAACGSNDSSDLPTANGSATATSAPASAAGPSPQLLQQQLELLADPARPAPEKATVVVDGETRLANLETLTAALANYPITFALSDVKTAGATTTAKVAVTSPHGAMPVPMTWQSVNGKWKLSSESACSLLAMGRAPCQ